MSSRNDLSNPSTYEEERWKIENRERAREGYKEQERQRVRAKEWGHFFHPFSSYILHENLIKLSTTFLLYFLHFCIESEEFFAQRFLSSCFLFPEGFLSLPLNHKSHGCMSKANCQMLIVYFRSLHACDNNDLMNISFTLKFSDFPWCFLLAKRSGYSIFPIISSQKSVHKKCWLLLLLSW